MSDGRNYEAKLREEAVERIKYFKKELKKVELGLDINLKYETVENRKLRKDTLWTYFCKLNGRILELIEFFNITEEDLR